MPVLVRQGRLIAATFHPELTDDLRVHALLLRGSSRDVGCAEGFC
jgi:5'-phosphate synthase pdxT subunit